MSGYYYGYQPVPRGKTSATNIRKHILFIDLIYVGTWTVEIPSKLVLIRI